MANRKRTNPVQFYLDDDEQYILDEKFRLSGLKSKSAFCESSFCMAMSMTWITVI